MNDSINPARFKKELDKLSFMELADFERLNMLTQTIFDDTEKEVKQTQKIVAFLYFKMALVTDMSLTDVFERFDWTYTDDVKDYISTYKSLLQAPTREVTIRLIPRTRVSTSKIVYREMAEQALELVRKEFNIPKEGLSFD